MRVLAPLPVDEVRLWREQLARGDLSFGGGITMEEPRCPSPHPSGGWGTGPRAGSRCPYAYACVVDERRLAERPCSDRRGGGVRGIRLMARVPRHERVAHHARECPEGREAARVTLSEMREGVGEERRGGAGDAVGPPRGERRGGEAGDERGFLRMSAGGSGTDRDHSCDRSWPQAQEREPPPSLSSQPDLHPGFDLGQSPERE